MCKSYLSAIGNHLHLMNGNSTCRRIFFFQKGSVLKSNSILVPSFSCRKCKPRSAAYLGTTEILVEWNKRIYNWGEKLVSKDKGVIARGKIKKKTHGKNRRRQIKPLKKDCIADKFFVQPLILFIESQLTWGLNGQYLHKLQ